MCAHSRCAVVLVSFGLSLALGAVPALSQPRLAQSTPSAVCLVGEHGGIDEADANTAARLVCSELRRNGIDVSQPVSDPAGAQEAYRVSLWSLGQALVLELSHESPIGDVKAQERVQIPQIEAVIDVAPTIAEDLVRGEEQAGEVTPPPNPPPAQTSGGSGALAGGTACLVGEHSGVDPADAETAAGLVCEQLRQRGVSVSSPVHEPQGASQAYRITLRRLGEVIILDVTEENPVGNARDSRSIQLASIEEVTVGARRVARALVEGVPIEDTVERDTLVGGETREPGQMPGDTYFGIGILGLAMAGTDVIGAPGLILKFFYEAADYGIGSDMMFSGGSPGGDDNGMFFAWSVGAKYFFNPDNIGFFVGGGFSWDTIGAFRPSPDGSGDAEGVETGVGAYGETGLEFFRFYGSRLIAAVRVDAPFFSIDEEVDGEKTGTLYTVPISINVAYAW